MTYLIVSIKNMVADIITLNGCQAILLPPEFAIDDDKVYLKKEGNSVVLIPYHTPWQNLLDSLEMFTPDFMEDRIQPANDSRERLD